MWHLGQAATDRQSLQQKDHKEDIHRIWIFFFRTISISAKASVLVFDRHTPKKVNLKFNGKVLTCSVGRTHICVIDTANRLQCWGQNKSVKLGVGHNSSNEMSPAMVSQGDNAIKISAGEAHISFVKNDATVWCFGNKYNGQLGNESNDNSNTPVKVTLLSALVTPLNIGAGLFHMCISTNVINIIYCLGTR